MGNVIVVGAGLAGLSAGYRLRQKGFKVLILEASDRAGGRMRSLERKGDRIDVGTQSVRSNQPAVLRLIDEMNLGSTKRKIKQTALFCLDDGSTYLMNPNVPYMKILGPRGNAELLSLAIKYLALGHRFSPYRIDKDIPEYDNVSGLSICGKPSQKPVKDFFVEPLVMEPPDRLSLYHVLRTIRFMLSQPIGMTRGMASLSEELAERLPVKYESPAKQLVMEKGRIIGVELEGKGSVERADHTVIAADPVSAAKMMPPEMAEERQFFESIPYVGIPMVIFFLDRRVHEHTWTYFNRPGLRNTVMFAIDETAKMPEMVPSGKSIFTVWLGIPTNNNMMGEPDDLIIETARDNMEPILPGFSQWIEEAAVVRFPFAGPDYDLGAHRRVMDFCDRAKKMQGVSFAGDLFAGGFTESAVESSDAVVRRICETEATV